MRCGSSPGEGAGGHSEGVAKLHREGEKDMQICLYGTEHIQRVVHGGHQHGPDYVFGSLETSNHPTAAFLSSEDLGQKQQQLSSSW